MASPNGSKTGQNGEITPQEVARIQASVRGAEQAPSTRQQVGAFANWRQVQDKLGQPFNNEQIPISKLKLMRRDPMLGFGLHYQKVPLVRAPWYMESADPQVAGFMDGTLRPIMGSLIVALAQKLDFGFQALAKRFQLKAPEGNYIDEASGEEKPVWDQTGNIQPITLKPFVPLPPEAVSPMFDDSTGEFAGIEYLPPAGGAPAGMGSRSKGPGGSEGQVEIDLYHSLWATNEIESVFGNIFGYPRLGYSYPYWWSYWFRWAIADRAFEKKGDPSIMVRHPEGKIDLGDGQEVSNAEYALMIADRIRSGAGIALPSTPYTNFEDRPSQVQEWDIEFLKGGVELEPFDKSFDYLDVMKLRSIFVPEQALIEGGGGTSSRNVAEEMFNGLVEGQSLTMQEIVDTINRWIIPHLLWVNFPDKAAQGITCLMKVRGFAAQDMEMLTQIVQLIGQANPEELGIDVREALRQMNMPLLSEQAYQDNLKKAAEAAAAAGPPNVAPTSSTSGVVPTPGKSPSTGSNTPGSATGGQGGSFTGFTYVPPSGGPSIELTSLSSAGAEFIAGLPPSVHYQDSTMQSLTRQLWNLIESFYRDQYTSFAEFLDSQEGEIQLSDEDHDGDIELAVPELVRDISRKLIGRWPGDLSKLDAALKHSSSIIESMTKRASLLARKSASIKDSDTSSEEIKNWVSSHVADLLSGAVRSIRDELIDFSAGRINEGSTDHKELATQVRAHFGDFPIWKAGRFARTEARDAFNAGTLLAGKAAGLTVAQAIDGNSGNSDASCEHRDGQFFTIDQALQEEEHPNGTLGWRLVKEPVTLARVEEVPGSVPGALASFDSETNTIFLSRDISPESESQYLLAIGERLS